MVEVTIYDMIRTMIPGYDVRDFGDDEYGIFVPDEATLDDIKSKLKERLNVSKFNNRTAFAQGSTILCFTAIA